MKFRLLKQGDRVLSVTSDLIAIERSTGEIDIYRIVSDNDKVKIITNSKTTVTFESKVKETQIGDVTVTTF